MTFLSSTDTLVPAWKGSLYLAGVSPDQDFGKRLKQAREAKGLTQQDLANVFGITDKAVSSWERGKHPPEPEKWGRLEKALGRPIGWLFQGRDDNLSTNIVTDRQPPGTVHSRSGNGSEVGMDSVSLRYMVRGMVEEILEERGFRAKPPRKARPARGRIATKRPSKASGG